MRLEYEIMHLPNINSSQFFFYKRKMNKNNYLRKISIKMNIIWNHENCKYLFNFMERDIGKLNRLVYYFVSLNINLIVNYVGGSSYVVRIVIMLFYDEVRFE